MFPHHQVEHATTLLRQEIPALIAIYLYGSVAVDMARPDSDIDLGVLADSPIDRASLLDLQLRLSDVLERDVDLVDLARANPVLLMQVLEGKVLYCGNPRKLAEFENLAMSCYCRLNEERKGILQDIVARGRVYA